MADDGLSWPFPDHLPRVSPGCQAMPGGIAKGKGRTRAEDDGTRVARRILWPFDLHAHSADPAVADPIDLLAPPENHLCSAAKRSRPAPKRFLKGCGSISTYGPELGLQVFESGTDCWMAGISMLCPASSQSIRARRSRLTSLSAVYDGRGAHSGRWRTDGAAWRIFPFVSEQMQVAVVGAAVNEPLNQPGIAMIVDSGNADLISVCNGSAGFARPTCSIVLTNGTVTARLIARHRDWMPGWSCTDKRICVGDAASQASTSPPYFQ